MSKRDPRGRPSADRTSLYDEITGKILAELAVNDPAAFVGLVKVAQANQPTAA